MVVYENHISALRLLNEKLNCFCGIPDEPLKAEDLTVKGSYYSVVNE